MPDDDDLDSLAFVIAEWPKVVESVFILRSQVYLACELQGNAIFSELIVGLDDKLAFLKGCVGSPPMSVTGFQERRRYFGERWKNGLWSTM
jgi:hypothetical protein